MDDCGDVAPEGLPRRLRLCGEDERLEDLRRSEQRDQRQQVGQKDSGEIASEVVLAALEFGRIVPQWRLLRKATNFHQNMLPCLPSMSHAQ